MNQTVIIAEDIFDNASREIVECDNICDMLMERYAEWPDYANIYYEQISTDRNVTPRDEADCIKLGQTPGTYYVVFHPGDPTTIIIAVVASLLVAAAAFLLRPSLPALPTQRNSQSSSPNNDLSQRVNRARPGARIPDILGEVRSVPDLIALPYKTFVNNVEVETAYMCVGRGYHDISDIRDGDTLVSRLEGASAAVYDPFTSPNSGGSPAIQIGDAIPDPVLNVSRLNEVNGQTLRAPNDSTITGSSNIRCHHKGIIEADPSSSLDFTTAFADGDDVTVSDAATGSYSLDGTFKIISVTEKEITLDNPSSVNVNWARLLFDGPTSYQSIGLDSSTDKWIGKFFVTNPDTTQLFLNFVAPNGIYKDDGTAQTTWAVTVEIGVTPADSSGNDSGTEETTTHVVQGSAVTTAQRALTVKLTPSFSGRMNVRVRRVTARDTAFTGNVVDEVKWRDAYSITPVSQTHFGNVTTVHSQTYATAGALTLKERKLTMNAIRKVNQKNVDNTFSSTLIASKSVADIFCFAALDPYIGGRDISELDVAGIYSTVTAVQTYFGSPDAIEFGHTFDDDSISFEETAHAIAAAAFCSPFRRGSLIQLFFEKLNTDSSLLFNHRNKLPRTEQRKYLFGRVNDYDGIELSYVDKDKMDAPANYLIPTDGSAERPQKIDTVGVRNERQAYWMAWRAWNKLRYQYLVTEFVATQRANMLTINERVLNADNSRPDTQDGEVVSQDGLTLNLSQSVTFAPGKTYTMFLQIPNATVDVKTVTVGSNSKQVIIDSEPSSALSLDVDAVERAGYWIVPDDDGRAQAFLIQEKENEDQFTYRVTAVNYDARYYANDSIDPLA